MVRAPSFVGLARLQRKLERLDRVALATIRSAMEQSADDIVRMAKSLVPVDSGALRESIGWTWGAPPRGSLTLGKVARSALGKQLTITIFAGDDDAFYARWVEFGTAPHLFGARVGVRDTDVNQHKTHGRKAYRTHPGTKAHPYFYPSWRANKKPAKKNIRRAIRRAAQAVAKGQ